MDTIINKSILFDYFSGQASPLQKKAVETWLEEHPNRELYYQWLHEWELNHLQATTNWQLAFSKTAQRVRVPINNQTSDHSSLTQHWWQRITNSSPRFKIGVMAASLLFVLGTISWFERGQLLYKTLQTAYGEVSTYILPDGTVVTLNANSSLQYPRFGFNQFAILGQAFNSRTVLLKGEADFSVRHLPSHQKFVVNTMKGLTVTVLGTQFTVLSRPRSTRVVLHSGRVQLSLPSKLGKSALTMTPGDLVTLSPNGRLSVTPVVHTEKLLAWKQHRFTFQETSLGEIAEMLTENYGLEVTLADPNLANRTISGSFPAQNAEEVLQVVAELLQLNYHRNNNHVTFTE